MMRILRSSVWFMEGCKKRFCQYIKENTSDGENHVLINGILAFAIRKLQMDHENSVNDLHFSAYTYWKVAST